MAGRIQVLLVVVLTLGLVAQSQQRSLAKRESRTLLQASPSAQQPCVWITDNVAGKPEGCATNDDFTLALPKPTVEGSFALAVYTSIQSNKYCASLNKYVSPPNEEICLTQVDSAANQCVFNDGACQGNSYQLLADASCEGSPARAYYDCAELNDVGACTKAPACVWRADLIAKPNTVTAADAPTSKAYEACFPADVVEGITSADQLKALLDTKLDTTTNNGTAFKEFWGDCTTTQAALDRQDYLNRCNDSKDKTTCLAETPNKPACLFDEMTEGKGCQPDPTTKYSFVLSILGNKDDALTKQFDLCAGATLTTPAACAAARLA